MAAETPSLTDEQWALLKAAPNHIFALVASTDSLADRNEWTAYRSAVEAATSDQDEIVRNVAALLSRELGENTVPGGDAAKALAGLEEVRVLSAALPGAGAAFRTFLVELGRTIAEASGAQLTRNFATGSGTAWTMSSGTSAMERESIARAAEALGLD
jgi:hypothetical protein